MIGPGEIPKPPGYQPGQTRAWLIKDVTVPLATFAVTLACLRFYVRACLVKVFGKDDWLLLVSVLLLCGIVGLSLYHTTLGLGKHLYDVVREIDPTRALVVCYSFFYVLW